jgi:hypothetical protein
LPWPRESIAQLNRLYIQGQYQLSQEVDGVDRDESGITVRRARSSVSDHQYGEVLR